MGLSAQFAIENYEREIRLKCVDSSSKQYYNENIGAF